MTRVILSNNKTTLPECELRRERDGYWVVTFDGSNSQNTFDMSDWSIQYVQELPTTPGSVITVPDCTYPLILRTDGRWYDTYGYKTEVDPYRGFRVLKGVEE